MWNRSSYGCQTINGSGITHINTLLGPSLTITGTAPISVSSSGTNINITSSAGGGNLVGTLTTNDIPVATGATTLGNSHIDDGRTTANVLTATELFNLTPGDATATVPEANALFYGADPTGVADSTTAINNCMNATYVTFLRTCYLPIGTYHVTNALTLGTFQTLRGDGWNTVIDVSVDFNASATGVIVPSNSF